jgi:hypothetical protein
LKELWLNQNRLEAFFYLSQIKTFLLLILFLHFLDFKKGFGGLGFFWVWGFCGVLLIWASRACC